MHATHLHKAHAHGHGAALALAGAGLGVWVRNDEPPRPGRPKAYLQEGGGEGRLVSLDGREDGNFQAGLRRTVNFRALD